MLAVDLSLNVFRAAEHYRAKRIVFASSNWVVAGHRFSERPLTPDMPPWPVNPYGASKLFIERAGRDLQARAGIDFIALRIGYAQHAAGNVPGPHMEHGLWGQRMWVSDRDLCQALERAALATDLPFAVLNVMSANPGMRWDIEPTHRLLGFQPQDGHDAIDIPANEETDRMAHAASDVIARLQWLSGKW